MKQDWQTWRDSNPQPSALEAAALPIEPQVYDQHVLFNFFMHGVLAFEFTILLYFVALRGFAFIPGRLVIPLLALAAL